MIRISNIKVPAEKVMLKSESEVEKVLITYLIKKYNMKESEIERIKKIKQSLDARKKGELHYIYTLDVRVVKETRFLNKPNVTITPKDSYVFPKMGTKELKYPPVIIGMGPAGLFCGLMLARAGYRPIILERGEDMDSRVKTVETFWRESKLCDDSNVQFGEGGAGTFSDGKLNTLVKDPFGRHKMVLDILIAFGAPEEIGYLNKPHIGTDHLRQVVKNMREEILRLGGEVRFGAKVTDIVVKDHLLTGAVINEAETIPCEVLILAIGHSARDTFSMLNKRELSMEAKAFAIGVRMEHLQKMIGMEQYGPLYDKLPAADYKLTHTASKGRGVYSFCMCPGGFVVNASSEQGGLAVNGMSNYDRKEENANSAIIVSVNPEDFEGSGPLAGVEFQRKWEQLAYKEGNGTVPVQRLGDFKEDKTTAAFGKIKPGTKGSSQMANLRNCLPEYITESLLEAMEEFGKKIKGFADEDAILSGVETRTSSPVRIIRDKETLESSQKGIYPCGEGAGYAGGIVSAAMDGIKIYEKITSLYQA